MKDKYLASQAAASGVGAGDDALDLATDAAALVDSTEDEGLPDLFYLNDLEAEDYEICLDELDY